MKSTSFGVQICFQENQFSEKKRKKERKLIIKQFGKLKLIIEQMIWQKINVMKKRKGLRT